MQHLRLTVWAPNAFCSHDELQSTGYCPDWRCCGLSKTRQGVLRSVAKSIAMLEELVLDDLWVSFDSVRAARHKLPKVSWIELLIGGGPPQC